MSRPPLKGVALIVAGTAAGAVAWHWPPGHDIEKPRRVERPSAERADSQKSAGDVPVQRRPAGSAALDTRLRALESRLAAEAEQRQALEGQVAALRDELAALHAASTGAAADHDRETADGGSAPAAIEGGATRAAADAAPPVDVSLSPTERALIAAGVDTAVAEDIKRRGDELALAEMYLRDQAQRENWINTPRFTEELAAIQSQQTSIRDEVGDAAYDGYLFALGRPNRVIVEDVLSESAAEQAGLRAGDLILRYGEARIFHREDLVEQTRSGAAGESVLLDVMRNGERVVVEVPRGPLGVRIGAAQDYPEAG